MGTRHYVYGWWKDQQAAVINAELVTITLTGTSTVAIIYDALTGGSVIVNGQITVSEVGFFEFFVDEDNYATTQKFRYTFTGGKFKTVTLDNQAIFPGITTTSTDTLSNKSLEDSTVLFVDDGDNTKKLAFQCSGIAAGTKRTLTIQNKSGTIPVTSDKLSVFAATTSAELAGVISDETGSGGGFVRATNPTVSSPVINTAISGTAVLDEDDMSSDSNTKVATQQSIKKYVDDNTITLTAKQDSTGGGVTAIDFTSIPAGTKKITVMLVGVSTDGTEELLVQIGTSGTAETSGYLSTAETGTSPVASTAGFLLETAGGVASVHHGAVTLTLQESATFTWVSSSNINRSDSDVVYIGAGSKSLAAELDMVRVTTTGTPDDFDAGTISIQFE